MTKINKFIIKSYVIPFITTFVVMLFILLMQFVWKYIDDLVGKGLDFSVIAKLLFYAMATFVPLALPLSVLLSSLMTFGNLGERYELTAMKAAGISLNRIMMPLVGLSIIISIAAFIFANNVLPVANLKMGALLFDVRSQKPALNIKEGVFYKGIDSFTIKIGKKDKDNIGIHDILIFNHMEQNGNTNITVAKSGKMQVTPDKRFLIFNLYEGVNYYEGRVSQRKKLENPADLSKVVREYPFRRISFKEQFRVFDLSAFSLQRTNEEFFKSNYQMLTIGQLSMAIDSLNTELDSLRQHFILQGIEEEKKRIPNEVAKNDTITDFYQGVFVALRPTYKKQVVDIALNDARNQYANASYRYEEFSAKQRYINKHYIAIHGKYTIAFACFVLFFIGAPLGAIIKKGGIGLPLVISVLFFVLFHILSTTGNKFAKEEVLSPMVGMWLASAILLPMGVYITYKATADSPLFDGFDWWKIMSFWKNKGGKS